MIKAVDASVINTLNANTKATNVIDGLTQTTKVQSKESDDLLWLRIDLESRSCVKVWFNFAGRAEFFSAFKFVHLLTVLCNTYVNYKNDK